MEHVFARDGFEIYPSFIDDEIISTIENTVSKLADKYESNPSEYSSRACCFTPSGKVNSMHQLEVMPFFREVSETTKLIDLASNILGSDAEPFGVEYYAKPAFVGRPAPPHQDNFYWKFNNGNAITVWLALSISKPSNGSLYFYHGSHLLGDIDHSPSNVPGTSQEINAHVMSDLNLGSASQITLQRGDCLAHHSRAIHGSTANESPDPRRGLAIRYKSKSEKVNYTKRDEYVKQLQDQLTSRGDNLGFSH